MQENHGSRASVLDWGIKQLVDVQGDTIGKAGAKYMLLPLGVAARIEALYEGLKPPALRRYGETDDRTDELI